MAIINRMRKRNHYYLAVKAKSEQHKEEKSCPEGGQWHQGHSLGVGNKCQTWTCTARKYQYLCHCLLADFRTKLQCVNYTVNFRGVRILI